MDDSAEHVERGVMLAVTNGKLLQCVEAKPWHCKVQYKSHDTNEGAAMLWRGLHVV